MSSLQLKQDENGYEDPKLWAGNLYTTVDHIAKFIDVPVLSLKRKDRFHQPKIQTRLIEIHALLRRVRPWFSSDQAAWAWYIGEPLTSLGRLTPSEVVKQYKDAGIEALNDYVTSKEMGGFE